MRHRKANRKLGRRSGPRRALLRNLVEGLFLASPTEEHAERIQTTPEKAKEARRLAERLITLGKRGTLAARRRALELLPNKKAVRKLFDEIAPRYEDREGGYTRILRLGTRRVGDAAGQVLFELVGLAEEVAVKPEVAVEEPEPAAEEAEAEPEAEEGAAPEAEAEETTEEEPEPKE
jgi:large subunit ribosomal protein L17